MAINATSKHKISCPKENFMAKVSLQRITIIIMLSLLVMYPIVEKIFLNKYFDLEYQGLFGVWGHEVYSNLWFTTSESIPLPMLHSKVGKGCLFKWVFLGKDVNAQQRQTDTEILQFYWKLVLCMTKNITLLTMGFDVNAESWKKCLTCSLSAAAK